MAEFEYLFWVDVETTGLDPRKCELLQVASLITDLDGNELADPFERVVQHGNPEELRAGAIPLVQEMHDNTGLWSRLPEGDPLNIVDAHLKDYISSVAPAVRQARLAGSSCRLDLNFIEHFLPVTYQHLHYRSVDVTAMAYAMDSWYSIGYYEKKKSHDAVDDIRESLEEYRWIREQLNSMMT